MNYTASPLAIILFLSFVATVLGISYHFARKTKSASGYFAAGGNIHWSVNGIAFAGDYLSAASFLGICGMIAVSGYDGFLYSIGYLAGWVVALFIVAEPMKRLGKYTFTDALDSKYNSKGIQLVSAISTILVSLFYLIPQMVGAGSLVTPLLGLPHWAGVVMVGIIVIIIVATAGMTSTTYVQFFKGGMLVVFSLTLVFLLFSRGISTAPDQGGDVPYHNFITLEASLDKTGKIYIKDPSYKILSQIDADAKGKKLHFIRLEKAGLPSIWKFNETKSLLEETLYIENKKNGEALYNGAKKEEGKFFQVGHMSEIDGKANNKTNTLNTMSFIEKIKNGTVVRWNKQVVATDDGKISIFYQNPTPGKDILKPGLKFKVDSKKGATTTDKIDFISLMLALFLGTAALPHILIRYYTVPSPACARKSTIVAIAAIGLFYVLTLYMGLGSMVSGVIDLTNDNMSAPLLAKSFGVTIFAIISALAFATVLGTVSGLIVAASGAVAHDFMDRFLGRNMSDHAKVKAGKIAAVVVGAIAVVLGILFKGMNVSYLVGWAFSIAASANLPAIIMILFWKKTTAKGVMSSITVGLVSALGLILLSQETYNNVYGLVNVTAPVPINNPAIISVPLSFLTLVVVSYMTQKKKERSK
ncbi:MAG: cation acetate symporter [Candidatus Firestonebacteria bacterium RIFOXYA2_FULL_40_8]|nr:MAG: cation acetate symporter [Candidatus Firestonebacteria bacterium RIFOXYA2_FULL_40_8]